MAVPIRHTEAQAEVWQDYGMRSAVPRPLPWPLWGSCCSISSALPAPNYTWANTVSRGALSKPVMDGLVQVFNLPSAPGNAVIPFFSVKQYESSGASVYHAVTLTLRKRFTRSYQLLASWTRSHSIDDSTDLQTLQDPQDNKNPRLDRSNSNFDQRHRFVVSGVVDSPWKSRAVLKDYFLPPLRFPPDSLTTC